MLESLLNDPDKVGGILYLILTVVSFIKGWVVPSWVYQMVKKDADFFRELAYRGTELAERSVSAKVVLKDKE
jgi:hypothetical protein